MRDSTTDFYLPTADTLSSGRLNAILAQARTELLRRPVDGSDRSAAPRGTVFVPPGVWVWDADDPVDATLPPEMELWLAPGAQLLPTCSLGTGREVTVRGTFRVGLHPVFAREVSPPAGRDAAGVVFGPGSCPVLRPEWWAPVVPAAPVDDVALQRAIDAAVRSGVRFEEYPTVEVTRPVVLAQTVRVSMPAGASSSRLTVRGRSTVSNLSPDDADVRASFVTPPLTGTIRGGGGPVAAPSAQVSALDGVRLDAMIRVVGASKVLFEQLSLQASPGVSAVLSLQAAQVREPGDEVVLRGCDLRGASVALVDLVPPPGSSSSSGPLRVSLEQCRLDGGDGAGVAQRNVGVRARSRDYVVAVSGSAFVGAAAAMIDADGATIELSASWFRNRAPCVFVQGDLWDDVAANRGSPRPGTPRQGIDVRLRGTVPSAGGAASSLRARLCHSTSDMFLSRERPTAEDASTAPTHLVGVVHEPARIRPTASVFWSSDDPSVPLILTGCSLLVTEVELVAPTALGDARVMPHRAVPVWLDGANPAVVDVGTVQSHEWSSFYGRSGRVFQPWVRTLTFFNGTFDEISFGA